MKTTIGPRTCKECGEFKPEDRMIVGRHWCRACAYKYEKAHRKPRDNRKSEKEWYARNKALAIARAAEWRKANPEKARESRRKWVARNPERVREISRRNMKKAAARPEYKLKTRISARMRTALKQGQRSLTLSRLGYSVDELKAHLERQFTKGMSWENMGEWHIDHIVPLSSFDVLTDEGLRRAWALPNLRPLWAIENRRKFNKRLFLI